MQEIVYDSLGLKKLTSRWIPHDLTDKNRKDRVDACRENLARLCDVITGDESWFYLGQIGHKPANASWVAKGDFPLTVVLRDRFEPKSMYSIFFKTTGLVHIDCLESGETISGQYYIENCLKPIVKDINKQRPTSGTTNLKFLYDNARPHVQIAVKSYLNDAGFTLICHPPYSPDLAPSDFWLFDHIKSHLGDHENVKSQKLQITRIMRDIPKEEYRKTFEKWLQRM